MTAERMTLEEMRNHEWIVAWSGGKDSTATIILMHENRIPIEKIIYVRMMWDEDLPATLPVMTDFVDRAAEVFRAWGYDVQFVKSIRTGRELAERVYKRSRYPERNGMRYGITAFLRGACSFTGVKQMTIRQAQDTSAFNMIGYAADEGARIPRLGGRNQSVMVALGITEEEASDICRKYGLLSPLYGLGVKRDGCFFCPNAKAAERKMLMDTHPELVKIIFGMIEDSPEQTGTYANNWLKEYRKQCGKDSLQPQGKTMECEREVKMGRGGGKGIANRGAAIKSAAKAKDYKQLGQYMLSEFGMSIGNDVEKNIPFELVRRCCEDFDDVRREFGSEVLLMAVDVKLIEGNLPKVFNNSYAAAGQHELFMSRKLLGNLESLKKMYEEDTRGGFHPNGTTYENIMTHEVGHLITFELARKVGKPFKQFSEEVVSKALSRAVAQEGGGWAGPSDYFRLAGAISDYAKKNPGETIAEAYADYRANGANASHLSKQIMKVLKEAKPE